MNNSEPNGNTGSGSFLTRCGRSLVSPKGLRRVAWGLVWLITLIAVAYAVEGFRGNHAWKQAQQALETSGAPYDFRTLIPKAVPDDQNFGSLPLVTSWFAKSNKSSNVGHPPDYFQTASSRLAKPKIKQTEAQPRVPTDLIAWSEAFLSISNQAAAGSNADLVSIAPTPDDKNTPDARAAAARIVLAAMEVERAKYDALREGLQRPYARYPIDYSSDNAFAITLPHLAKLKDISARLQLRVSAELAAGDPAAALADVHLMLGLADTLKSDPILISLLVRLAMLNLAVQSVWEGEHYHLWRPADLVELEQAFAGYNFVSDLLWSSNAERAGALSTIDYCRRNKSFAILNAAADVESEHPPGGGGLGKLVPNGWFLMEMANYSETMSEWQKGFDPTQRRVKPSIMNAQAEALGARFGSGFTSVVGVLWHHNLATRILIPAFANVTRAVAAGQASADQARIACALERFRLARGNYPESLKVLAEAENTKAPLALDVITGEPYQYKIVGDSFLLYSVGWDEKDDGGKAVPLRSTTLNGDWTWGWSFRR